MESNATVGNYLAMCERASQIIHERPEFLAPGAKLTEYLQFLDDKITLLRDNGAARGRLEKAPAKAKNQGKAEVELLRKRLADALLTHSTESKDIALQHRAGEYSRKANFKTDIDLKSNFKLLVEDARAEARPLEAYNIREADIQEAESLLAALPTIINQTKVARGQRKLKTGERDQELANLRAFFKLKLDPCVRGLRDEKFVEIYNAMRRLPQTATVAGESQPNIAGEPEMTASSNKMVEPAPNSPDAPESVQSSPGMAPKPAKQKTAPPSEILVHENGQLHS